MEEIPSLDLLGLRRAVRGGEISRREVAEAFLRRAEAREDRLGAWITLREEVVEEAEAADRAATDRASGPLEGLPIALKDNLCTEGIRTTCASRILANWIPPYDATAWCRLRAGGAVLSGKTNMDEFGMGSSTEHSSFHPTTNPWNPERVPGGSSGGSAAAVAAGVVPAALGSDTGGSIRQPAALCGVVGLKPTYGRVSRFGLVAFASSLDQVGPIAHTPADCALLLDAISGPDPRDATSLEPPAEEGSFLEATLEDPRPFRFGAPPEATAEGVEPEVRRAFEQSCRTLESIGGEGVDIHLDGIESAIAVYYVIAPCEASSNLARYDGARFGSRREGKDLDDTYRRTRTEGFGAEVKRRIMLGTYALSSGYYDAYYLQASRARAALRRELEAAFRRVDVIVTPTTPTTAFRLGAKLDDPVAMYLNDAFTVPANLAGLPGISVPCGLDARRLPIGLQIVGPAFSEPRLLRIAHHFLAERPFDARPPA